ncbi:hypothetical protein [Candidatus Neomicrothrix sp.]|nr:hypothetical protein [Candidatus Microthrix sp.]
MFEGYEKWAGTARATWLDRRRPSGPTTANAIISIQELVARR